VWWVRLALAGVLLAAAAPGRAETDDPANSNRVVDVEIDSAIQALRGQIVAQGGDLLQVQTTTRQVMVRPPAGFSAPVGACIQVSGPVPLGPVFEAEQASLVSPEDRAAVCPQDVNGTE
jgi:hypothetical protein